MHTIVPKITWEVPQQVNISSNSVIEESPVKGCGESSMRCIQGPLLHYSNLKAIPLNPFCNMFS